MKLYLKYMFSNPFITRVRVHSDLKLPSLRDLHKTPALTSDQIPFNLRLLLKKSETLNEGGQGVSLIANLSLRDLMKRWASFMLERALTKLYKIIEMLEKEVKIRGFSKQQKAIKDGVETPDQGSSSDESEEEEEVETPEEDTKSPKKAL